MTNWITIFVALIIGWVIVEEGIYYFWNKYIFDSENKQIVRFKEWKNKFINFIKKYKRSPSH